MIQERTVTVARTSIADFHAALAWAVQTYDSEFANATMVRLTVEQTYRSGSDDEPEWHYTWSAAVAGLVEEKEIGTDETERGGPR